MKRIILIALLLAALAILPQVTLANSLATCPLHASSSCYYTGENKTTPEGKLLWKFHCTCGDDWWVPQ